MANPEYLQPTLRVFVSYAKQDRKWLEAIQQALAPLVRQGAIELWADSSLEMSAEWDREIEEAIHDAHVAIVLRSMASEASTYIATREMPLLHRAQQHGLKIVQVRITDCLPDDRLDSIQALNFDKPLNQMPRAKLQLLLVSLGGFLTAERDRLTRFHVIESTADPLWSRAMALYRSTFPESERESGETLGAWLDGRPCPYADVFADSRSLPSGVEPPPIDYFSVVAVLPSGEVNGFAWIENFVGRGAAYICYVIANRDAQGQRHAYRGPELDRPMLMMMRLAQKTVRAKNAELAGNGGLQTAHWLFECDRQIDAGGLGKKALAREARFSSVAEAIGLTMNLLSANYLQPPLMKAKAEFTRGLLKTEAVPLDLWCVSDPTLTPVPEAVPEIGAKELVRAFYESEFAHLPNDIRERYIAIALKSPTSRPRAEDVLLSELADLPD